MRKYIKTDLCNIIDQLVNVNETLISKGKGVSQEQVQGILTDCQQGAVDVGSKIEEVEGEGTEAVRLLEEYCEKVYLLCINWTDEKLRDKELKNIRVLLNKVKNSILYDIKDSKKEVVFLPYKASMWDSLESVWKKADEDPECDAYVIPIPYFDKNPDGSFREMHYEGDLYPKYVPITDWQAYDLEKRHPDVIFIHNPYDEANFVTSVHPQYYSKVIKDYTDKLVYIPYFVLNEIDPENEEAVESVAHFVTTPGVLHAHRVIVQSEQMKKVYVKVLTKLMGDEVDSKAYWEERILGLGSPKLDKVANTKVEDYEIPKEWKKIIQKVDGTNKKIVFYNVGVAGLLKHNEQMIEKMKYTFRVFKEYQDDVVLLFRPHPLIKATIESMRPRLWEAYKEIIERYIAEGWGIYDDTPDMDRAVAISDAFYGDGSSIVQLFKVVEKPVMLHNVDIV